MPEVPLRFSADQTDWAIALGLVALWLILTATVLVRRRRRPSDGAAALVICASQTGHAGDLAQQARLRIEAAGTLCALLDADHLTPELIAEARLLVFVAATTGEGEEPDNARHFAQGLLAAPADLSGKQVAVLALGDRRYAQFCAFGRRVAAWAEQSGAGLLFPPIEIDDLNPAEIAIWDERLTEAGYPANAVPEAPAETRWQVVSREQVAGPSHDRTGALTGDGLYRIVLRPVGTPLPDWEIGDLFELRTPDGHLRDYSIASLPSDDAVLLYVRRVIDQGRTGLGSGHLTDAEPGAANLLGRIRSHRSFRPPSGQGPLLAIGAGSGWGGLRPHLLHAIALGQPIRLVFGERAGEAASPLLAEIESWRRDGKLERLDLALSQAAGVGPYVQHVLTAAGSDITDFLGVEGRIAICGRLAMGEQSLAELAGVLGEDWLTKARDAGRLLRDLY